MKKQHTFFNVSDRAGSLPVDIEKFINTSKEEFSEKYKVNIDDVYIDTIDVCARVCIEGGYLCTLVLSSEVKEGE